MNSIPFMVKVAYIILKLSNQLSPNTISEL